PPAEDRQAARFVQPIQPLPVRTPKRGAVMRRRLARRLLPGVVGLGLVGGCRRDAAAGPGGPPLPPPLDLTAVQEAAKSPPPPRPVEPPPAGRVPLEKRLQVPPEIPGANAPPIRLPPPDPERKAERDRLITELYGPTPPIPPDPVPTEGPRLDLAQLERDALALHPTIRQAASAVESARGAALQAGLPPNPSFGFEADTIGSGGTAGQQGVKYEQLIK